MKFLVTGGAGFIGSNFLHYMVKKYPKDYFVCLDLLTYAGDYDNIRTLETCDNFKFVYGDIRNADEINSLFLREKFDVVVNFAAETHVDTSIKNPNIFLETNVMGTVNLLNAVKEMETIYKVKRFHQISTDEVYGDLPLDKAQLSFNETSPLRPSSPYSASKTSADLFVLAYARTYKIPVTISRCSNNYGAYQFPEKLIPLTILRALNNEKIPIYGNGKNVRDWIHVKDHNIGVDMIIRHGKNGEVYNLGGNSEKENIEVVKLILKILNKSEDLIEYVSDRKGHDLRYAMNYNKAKTMLGWEPQIDFKDGLKETIDWYLNNKKWLENLENRKPDINV